MIKVRPKDLVGPVYLSGPMSGEKENNYPAFNEAAEYLREWDVIVYNPAENFGGLLGLPRKEYMRQDIGHLLNSLSIIMLPGWSSSPGARLEIAIARELDLLVWSYQPRRTRLWMMLPDEAVEDHYPYTKTFGEARTC